MKDVSPGVLARVEHRPHILSRFLHKFPPKFVRQIFWRAWKKPLSAILIPWRSLIRQAILSTSREAISKR